MSNEEWLTAAGWKRLHQPCDLTMYRWSQDGIDWYTEDEALVVVLTAERDAAIARAERAERALCMLAPDDLPGIQLYLGDDGPGARRVRSRVHRPPCPCSKGEPMSAGTCPGCGADEVEAMTPCTVYACGTSSHDDRDGAWFGPCAEVNCCEHGDHPAPEGKRFCSAACRECECAPCAPGDNGCTGICRAAKVSR